MSTAAIWAFVAIGVLFVLAVALVLLAVRSTFRRSKALATELQDLSREAEAALRVGKPGRHAGKAD